MCPIENEVDQDDVSTICETEDEKCCICTDTISNSGGVFSVGYLYRTHNMEDQKLCDCSVSVLDSICMDCYFKGAMSVRISVPNTLFFGRRVDADIKHNCHMCKKTNQFSITRENWSKKYFQPPHETKVFWNLIQAFLFESDRTELYFTKVYVVGGAEMRDPNDYLMRTVPYYKVSLSLFKPHLLDLQIFTGLCIEKGCCGRFCHVVKLMKTVSINTIMQVNVKTTTHMKQKHPRVRRSKRIREANQETKNKRVCTVNDQVLGDAL